MEKMTGFQLAKIKTEGATIEIDEVDNSTSAQERPYVPMSIEMMQRDAQEAASLGLYFEIGPDDAKALSGYLTKLIQALEK